MKKTISLILVTLILTVTLAGCGDKDRLNYVKGLKDYVELCDFENISVDLNSAEYLEIYNGAISSDLETYTYPVEDGAVADGDTANIDYAGKVNGVAFTGGTAEGYDLTIGSGSFIEGFESQLVGVKVGETVDITVTFPADYGDSTDLETGSKTIVLSGADAVFTVKINSIKRHYSEVNDKFALAAGFENTDKYYTDLKERCIKSYICDYIIGNSTVTELPPDKDGNCYDYHKKYYTDYAVNGYGITFEELLSYNNMKEEDFKVEMLTQEVIMYAVFDALDLEVTEEATAAKTQELAELNETTVDEIKKAYDDNYIEYIYVNNMVINTLYEKIAISE